jgi:hypothetical protein
MDDDIRVKVALYRLIAETGRAPLPSEVSSRAGMDVARVLSAYRALRAQKVLWLESDGSTIRMAPPFSGVPTQHRVVVGDVEYYANCAWDALGIVAALHQSGRVLSRCEQSGEPLDLEVGLEGPERSSWLFHCLVPAARWWDDLVFT